MDTNTATSHNAAMRRTIMGFIVSRAVCAVTRAGIPDLLADGPRGVAELAGASGTDPGALGRFLRVLSAEGVLIEPEPGLYALSEAGNLLRADAPGSLRHFTELMSAEAYLVWGAAEESLSSGGSAFPSMFGSSYFTWLTDRPEAAERFDRAQAGLVELRLLPLLDWDWSAVDSVVDVGGGDGSLLRKTLADHPHLSGTLLDLPHVVENAEEDGVARVSGDFFEGVPEGADVYVLSQILHDWDDSEAVRILRACRKAIPAHGRLLVVEQILRNDGLPDPALLLDLHMLVLLGGRERTEPEWERLFAEGGFTLTSTRTGPRSALLEARPSE
ncbi:methyltransferase [Nocardiopsis alba]|uniref:methyltransferase n=1 Tax=Nocardiopsis alba TaxID=53437 RepID=UPI0035D972F2